MNGDSLREEKEVLMNGRSFVKQYSIFLLLLFLSLFTITAYGIEMPESPQEPQTAGSKRNQEIEKLLATIRERDVRTEHPDRLTNAVRRLGDLRATEAIDDLVELLTFSPKDFPGEIHSPEVIVEFQLARYPAVSALFQIGRPALPALVKAIEVHRLDSLTGQNALEAIQDIFREDLSDGVSYLQHAATESVNRYSAEDLREAASRVSKLAAQMRFLKK